MPRNNCCSIAFCCWVGLAAWQGDNLYLSAATRYDVDRLTQSAYEPVSEYQVSLVSRKVLLFSAYLLHLDAPKHSNLVEKLGND
jgi:hypothetical protein